MNAILSGAETLTIVSRLNKIDAASTVAVREQTRLIRQSLNGGPEEDEPDPEMMPDVLIDEDSVVIE